MTWCHLCDLDRSTCQHGLGDRLASRARSALILVSPARLAHFEGCPHKDDSDFTAWGTLTGPDAWQRLGNGERMEATDQHGVALVVQGRCSDCVEHGPW
jgi:hypothetical protein